MIFFSISIIIYLLNLNYCCLYLIIGSLAVSKYDIYNMESNDSIFYCLEENNYSILTLSAALT